MEVPYFHEEIGHQSCRITRKTIIVILLGSSRSLTKKLTDNTLTKYIPMKTLEQLKSNSNNEAKIEVKDSLYSLL